jgi:murein tripeptide amidase MpaA
MALGWPIMRSIFAAFAAFAVVPVSAFAQPVSNQMAPLPPVLAWHGPSERLVAAANDPWITPAEASNFERTPSYADTRAWLDRLVAASPLLSIDTFGRSPEGRDLYAVRAAKPGARPKPVVLVQAGIHAGEIDGKDAGLMLLRDIALRGKDRLLDKVDLVFVPIFNADGHERSSQYNRPNQRGPLEQGWRTTGQNLNLNRDYLKADTPEMKAMIGLLRKYQPALYLDLHVTDGLDYQYDITFMFNGWDGRFARSTQIGRWLDLHFRTSMTRKLLDEGHIPGPYVDAVDPRDPDKGIKLVADQPRYSTGYGDLARIPTVLVENHSLKPYRQRVLGTYVLIEHSLYLVGLLGDGLQAAIAADRASEPKYYTVSWKPARPLTVVPEFKGIAHDTYRSAASGRDEVRWLGKPVTQRMPVWIELPDKTVTLPRAWWVPATKPDVIALLRLHGIQFTTLVQPFTRALDMMRLVEPQTTGADEGHIPLEVKGFTHQTMQVTMPTGSVRVPSNQPLGYLAAAMLEPEDRDSLLAWNFFPEILQRTEYVEGYAIAPLADRMLASDPKLRAEFEKKLESDPKFAADGEARLEWFYARTPYYDARYLLYPVGREITN